MVGGLGGDIGLGLRVDWGALVGDLSDVAVDVVGSVLHGLDPAVRKGDLVRARDNTVGIAGLSGVEVGLGVVIGNTVGVGVGLWELLHHLDNRGVVGRGSVDHGSVGRGSMHHMVEGSGVDSVDKRSVNCMVSMADAVSDMGDMGDLGGASQTEEGGDHEGLKFGH